MTASVTRRIAGKRSVEFTEPRRSRQVPTACAALGVRYMRARHGGGWLVPIHYADDVEAYLAARGIATEAIL